MSHIKKLIHKQVYMGKLDHGKDLLDQLTEFAINNRIKCGKIIGIGAVQKAVIGYYDQNAKKYHFKELDRHLEILSVCGNISLKDGKPIVHAHITLGDEQGNSFGGHLAAGTIIFACEIIIEQFEGFEFERGYDEVTGLPLWKF